MFLLIVIVAAALSISFTCSILEAALLSSSVIELSSRARNGDRGAAVMLDLRENRVDDAISAILTYNTIAHTVGAAMSGAQAAVVFGDAWVGVFSGILTLLILIITEIIPKTVGTVYAGKLAGPVGRLINLMTKPPMKWVLYGTRAITGLFTKKGHHTTTRADVLAMVEIATRDGALPGDESRAITSFLGVNSVPCKEVMTPRTVVAFLDEASTLGEALVDTGVKAFSRVPLFREVRDNIRGYILSRDLLQAGIDGLDTATQLGRFVRPVMIVSGNLSVGEALKKFTKENEHLAVVEDDNGVVSGLVTMEDLLETALGVEIVDEFDEAIDLRQVAIQLRDRRQALMRERRFKVES